MNYDRSAPLLLTVNRWSCLEEDRFWISLMLVCKVIEEPVYLTPPVTGSWFVYVELCDFIQLNCPLEVLSKGCLHTCGGFEVSHHLSLIVNKFRHKGVNGIPYFWDMYCCLAD
jgi:hypothetical protein